MALLRLVLDTWECLIVIPAILKPRVFHLTLCLILRVNPTNCRLVDTTPLTPLNMSDGANLGKCPSNHLKLQDLSFKISNIMQQEPTTSRIGTFA